MGGRGKHNVMHKIRMMHDYYNIVKLRNTIIQYEIYRL